MSLPPSLAAVADAHACCRPATPAGTQGIPQIPTPVGAVTPSGSPASFQSALEQALAPPALARDSSSSQRAYPHLAGDLDSNPVLLDRLERLAAARGEDWTITSGARTFAEQQRLWDNRAANGFPVARPGRSSHESANAADVTIGGRPVQDVVGPAELIAAGLAPLAGDAVHLDLPRSA